MLEDWTEAVIVSLYKEKSDKDECRNYREISLLRIPGKVYVRFVTWCVKQITVQNK